MKHPPPPDFHSGCAGKRTFPTWHAAEREIRRARLRGARTIATGIYRCPFCRKYHRCTKVKDTRTWT